jgi:nucleotide-binding universal stress UspA family protein
MFEKILVPLDGSDEAATALPVATALARQFGASILLLEMISTGGATLALAADVASGAMTDPGVIQTEVTAREQAAEGYISAVAESLAGEGLDVSYAVGRGSEGEGIAEAAAHEGVDLIVMATHARGTLGRLVFGSVTDDVIRHTTVPVLAIPPLRDEHKHE